LSAPVLSRQFIVPGLLALSRPSGFHRSWVRSIAAQDLGQLGLPDAPWAPCPQSHSFSRSYGTILPTSLIYIILVGQRLLTLETWCGCGYDLVWYYLA